MNGNAQTTGITLLPLSALYLSKHNVRKTPRNPERIEQLAASIKSMGQIQNLVVRDEGEPGKFGTIVGGSRLLAMELLLSRSDIPADFPVKVDIRDDADATAVSLAENYQRDAMHPADEYDAFAKLVAEGKTIDQIADAFGVTPLVVERRLTLANAAPALLVLYRQDKISTDQLIALCATDDHARQVEVWESAPSWSRSASSLRNLIVGGDIDASKDKRVDFIGGVAAYEAAGGFVRRDLFSPDGVGGFLSDVLLLERLVAEKLESLAEGVRAEGWSWVEVRSEFDHSAFHRFGRAPMEEGPLSDEDAAAVAALKAEVDKLTDERDTLESQSDEYTDEQSERFDEIDDRLQAISEELDNIEGGAAVYTDAAKQHAGAWVTISNGMARIERGLVKTEDRKAVAKATGAAVEGGRETKPAGRKDNALSDPLRRSLLGRRNHAAQLATARNPRVAKVLLAVQMVRMVDRRGFTYGGDTIPSDLTLRDGGNGGTRTYHPVLGEDAEAIGDQLQEALEVLAGKLPKKDGELWDVLAQKSDAELDAIVAFGVGASVSLVDSHKSLTAKLLDALSFDVSHHVCTTADNYFGRVSKALILDALKDAGLDHDREQLEKMKKGELASEAERRLRAAGSGWVPKLIRTPVPKVAKNDADAGKKAATKSTTKPKAKKAAKGSKAKG